MNIFPKKTDGQQTHAKMLNITYQGNANQNYNEILPTSLRMAIIKKTTI